jgi:BlaI family penicillinase repressor
MARPGNKGLTDYELTVIKLLWEEAPLSVAEILERFPKKPKPAYTSLLTNVRAMEKKGYLRHQKEGKAFLYSPVLKKDDYKTSEIKKLIDRFFGGSKLELAVNLIKEEQLGAADMKKLKSILEDL